jgi:hypothetical protein
MAYQTICRAAQAAVAQDRFLLAASLFRHAARKAPNARAAYFAFELARDYAAA